MSLPGSLLVGLLDSVEGLAVGLLLVLVVLGEERSLLLPVRTLNVVDTLGDDAQLLVEIALLFFELGNLDGDETFGVDVLKFL